LHPYTKVKGWRTAPDPDDVTAAVKALLAARSPLLYVGEGVYYAGATAELLQFAEIAQVPVLTTLKAKGTFPENHPLSLWVRGSLAEHFLRKCDLLFSIGSSLFPNRFSHAIPDAQKKAIVQCTVDTLDINRSYETRHAVIGDAKLTLQALIDEHSKQAGGARKNAALVEEIRAGKQAFLAKFRPLMESSEKPINPYRVIGDLMKVLDPKASFVTADSGNTRDQTSTVYEAQIPRGHLGWGNVSTLGFSFAGAVAAKLAYPDRQCVNITGDAGVCYMMGNFEAVARYRIGVTTLHINNGGYSGYGPGFWGGGHDPYTWKVSDHASACMSSMARAVGFHGEDVKEPSEIIPALKRAFDENAKGRPAFLEFICSHHPVHGGWVGRS
ncbi:MAG TPA: thiamine pyrophosphate-dependent enzyme, partial [Burkholderiales bacterium]|nr:thiamine pyrophosphate-dependent enzyme [Burkholderiales bacterium]